MMESMMPSNLFETGMQVRRDVLGDEYVDNAIKNADPFAAPFQEFATEYCWGKLWAREGLPRKTRSMINIGMLIALNRAVELEVHIRGALRNGCTPEEIREVLLQAAVYCGVPAGGEAFRVARKVLSDSR
jgi:4-carboxymuconolactone decarboxylase